MTGARAAIAVLVVVAAAWLVRLETPSRYVHDECYQAFTAGRLAAGDRRAWDHHASRADMAAFREDDMTEWTYYEWIHPPTAKLVMTAGIEVAGRRPGAYRMGSVLFGLLTLAMTWLLARRLGGPRFALVALVLVAADGMVFVMSRVAMNDIYVTACGVTAIFFLHRFWTEDRLRWLIAGGVALGVGLGMKWNIVPLLLGCAAVTLFRLIRTRRGRALATGLGAWGAAFVVAPALLYLLAYTPYFLAGYGWDDLVSLHRAIFRYHRTLAVQHSMGSRWWEWPLVRRPVWFFEEDEGEAAREIYAMGNPLLWWAFVPALAWSALRFLRRRDPGDGAVVMAFCAYWLPWVFVDRVAFQQYLLPAVPFGAIAVARALDDLAARWPRAGRIVTATYAAAVIAVFASFYPFWSALSIPKTSLEGRRYYWFERWRAP